MSGTDTIGSESAAVPAAVAGGAAGAVAADRDVRRKERAAAVPDGQVVPAQVKAAELSEVLGEPPGLLPRIVAESGDREKALDHPVQRG